MKFNSEALAYHRLAIECITKRITEGSKNKDLFYHLVRNQFIFLAHGVVWMIQLITSLMNKVMETHGHFRWLSLNPEGQF